MSWRSLVVAGLALLSTCALGLAAAAPSGGASDSAVETAAPGQIPVEGDVSVHDPTLFKDGDTFIVAATGGSIRSAPSLEGPWTAHGEVPKAEWTDEVSPGPLWAPHVQRVGDTFYYYYAQSSFGSRTSAIGLKTTQTPTDPSSYVDHGEPIIASGAVSDSDDPYEHNAIDPNLHRDRNGDWWITWGSHWDGIMIQRLGSDMATVTGEMRRIAARSDSQNRIEGPAIFERGGYYYLLTGWDACCQGEDSTYKISVGRSESIDGPYVDRNGVPLTEGGGSTILDSRVARPGVTPEGLWRAPGGPDVFVEGETDYMAYHAYMPGGTLGIRPIDWHGGWPYFQEPGDGPYDLTDGARYRLRSEAGGGQAEIERVPGPDGFGTAMRLNGPTANRYVEAPAGIVSDLDGDFTIAAWVNLAEPDQTWSRIFDFGDDASSFMFLTPDAGGAEDGLRFDINTAAAPSQQITRTGPGAQLPTGWQHVAVTLQGDTGTLWVNGDPVAVSDGITSRPADLGETGRNWIGRSQFSADPDLNGAVDELRIFDRALSATGLEALIEPGGDGPGGGVLWYGFEEDGGPAVADSSGRGNDGVIFAAGWDPDRVHNPVPSDRCLTAVEDGGAANVIQAQCEEGLDGQVWALDREADGFWRFRGEAGSEEGCLAMANASGAPGTNVTLTSCAETEGLQRWYLDDAGHGFHRPVVEGADLALEIESAGGVIGTDVLGGRRRDATPAGTWPPQQWRLSMLPDEPELRLDAGPSIHRVGPERRRARYVLRARNVGGAHSGPVRLCVRAPAARVAVPRNRCVSRPLPPGAKRRRGAMIRIRPRARGKLTWIRLVARGPRIESRKVRLRLRVRR